MPSRFRKETRPNQSPEELAWRDPPPWTRFVTLSLETNHKAETVRMEEKQMRSNKKSVRERMQKFASDEGQQKKVQRRKEPPASLFTASKPKQNLTSYSCETSHAYTNSAGFNTFWGVSLNQGSVSNWGSRTPGGLLKNCRGLMQYTVSITKVTCKEC